MTTVYFVRHAQPDLSVHDDLTRPLTENLLKEKRLLIRSIGKTVKGVYIFSL